MECVLGIECLHPAVGVRARRGRGRASLQLRASPRARVHRSLQLRAPPLARVRRCSCPSTDAHRAALPRHHSSPPNHARLPANHARRPPPTRCCCPAAPHHTRCCFPRLLWTPSSAGNTSVSDHHLRAVQDTSRRLLPYIYLPAPSFAESSLPSFFSLYERIVIACFLFPPLLPVLHLLHTLLRSNESEISSTAGVTLPSRNCPYNPPPPTPLLPPPSCKINTTHHHIHHVDFRYI